MLSISKLKEAGIARDIRKKINECIDAIAALRIADGPGYRVKRTARGTVLGIDRKTDTESILGTTVQRFKITEIEENYLLCRKVNTAGDETSSSDVRVLRPNYLTSGEGLLSGAIQPVSLVGTQQRTYTLRRTNPTPPPATLDYSVTEVLWPPYLADDIIFGISPVIGGTLIQPEGEEINWLDLNVDGRHWQLELIQVGVCINTVERKALGALSQAAP